MASALIHIHPTDNVKIALRTLEAGRTHDGLTIRSETPRGHKIACRPIARGESVLKFGYPIGHATVDIAAGEHVHSHNLATSLHDNLTYHYDPVTPCVAQPAGPVPTFMGYRRPDGRVAIRNEIWIINTVGCVNISSQRIADAATRELCGPGSGIDGVYAFTHPYGCSQLGDDLLNTQKILAGLAKHPNAAAVLVLGLGCENNQIKQFLKQLPDVDPRRVKFFNAQDVQDEIESGLAAIRELAVDAGKHRREPIPATELILGMKCGGSDGFSGITANPLVGRIADRLSALGGTTLLTEVPEMFGAEQILMSRAVSEGVFQSTVKLINDFKDYFRRYQQPIYENPSPGNKDGGITTLEEKSLGCVQKGGLAPVKEILRYGEKATPRLGGLSLVCAPGNDGVSTTALTVAGAHMVLFTTGRGTPLGLPVPTVKISTNTPLAEKKPSWIDFNAGRIAEGTATLDAAADELLAQLLAIASGTERTKNELNGYREIALWKAGVTL